MDSSPVSPEISVDALMSELGERVDAWEAKGGQTTTDLVKHAAAKEAAFKHLSKEILGDTLDIRDLNEGDNEISRVVDNKTPPP